MKKQIALIAVCAVLALCVLTAGCSGPAASPTPSPASRSSSAAASTAQVITPSVTAASPSMVPTSSAMPSSSPSGGSASGLTLLFFYRPTCPKCQATEPAINQLQARYAGKVTVQRINFDDPANEAYISQYRAVEVPTIMLLKNGQKIPGVPTWIGQQDDASPIAAQIDSQLNAG